MKNLLLLFFCFSCSAAEYHIYCDSSAAGTGTGTFADPYKRLASVSWSTLRNMCRGQTNAFLELKRGSHFNETLGITQPGSNGYPIVIRDYGTGAKPIIDAGTNYAGWAVIDGTTYTNGATTEPGYLWAGGELLTRNTTNSLANLQWAWTNSIVYLRCDYGIPTNVLGETKGNVLTRAVQTTGQDYFLISNIVCMNGKSYGWDLGSISYSTLYGCESTNDYTSMSIKGTNVVFVDCIFSDAVAQCASTTASSSGTDLSYWFCIFNGVGSGSTALVNDAGPNTMRFYHCLFANSSSYGVNNTGASVIGLTNCVFYGIDGSLCVYSTAGTVNLESCIGEMSGIGGAVVKPWSGLSFTNNAIFSGPGFTLSPRKGVIGFSEDDTDNAPDWTNLNNIADQYGYKTSLAVYPALFLENTTISNIIQQQILAGHGISAHSRSHCNITNMFALQLRYVGAGSACSMTIASNKMYVTCTGDSGNDFVLDLTTNTLTTATNWIDAKAAFTCAPATADSAADKRIVANCLTNVAAADIKTASYVVMWDCWKKWTNEFGLSQSDLQASFTNADGSAYSVKSYVFTYAYSSDETRNFATNYYDGARSVSAADWKLRRLGLYYTAVVPDPCFGAVIYCPFTTDTLDKGSFGGGFTNVGVTFWTNGAWANPTASYGMSGGFNGTNAYMWRSDATNWQTDVFHDWLLCGFIYPSNTVNKGTILHHGTDANNWFSVSVTNGMFLVEVMSNGVNTLAFYSPAGSLTNGGWQKFAISQDNDVFNIRINESSVATSRGNLGGITKYTGLILSGCATNYVDSRVNYFSGGLDDLGFHNELKRRTTTFLNRLCSRGGFAVTLSHGASTPREAYRKMFDACAEYYGDLVISNYPTAISYLRSIGTVQNTNLVVTAKNTANYTPKNLYVATAQRGYPLVYPAGMTDINGQLIVTNTINLYRFTSIGPAFVNITNYPLRISSMF